MYKPGKLINYLSLPLNSSHLLPPKNELLPFLKPKQIWAYLKPPCERGSSVALTQGVSRPFLLRRDLHKSATSGPANSLSSPPSIPHFICPPLPSEPSSLTAGGGFLFVIYHHIFSLCLFYKRLSVSIPADGRRVGRWNAGKCRGSRWET